MAEASILVGCDEFCCSFCLDLLKDPVALSCGHSFCMNCINSYWDQQTEAYSCLQCRETFFQRPALQRNYMLTELVEKLTKAGRQSTSHCYATPGDVECDICTVRKCKAVKSCLVCLASYCEAHFKPHEESAPLKKHTVIEPSGQLQDKICQNHGRLLDVFCRTDQKCVCYLCALDKHCGHEVVSIAAERGEKQKLVIKFQNSCKERMQERKEYQQELMESVASLKHSAQKAVDDTERMFRELIQSTEKKCSEMTEAIRAQEKAELSRVEKHLKLVQQEMVDLRRKDDELQQLSHTEDDYCYLQVFQSFHGFNPSEDTPRVKINTLQSCEDMNILVHKLKEQVDSIKQHPNSSEQFTGQQVSKPTAEPLSSLGFGSVAKPTAKPLSSFSLGSVSKPTADPRVRSVLGLCPNLLLTP